jgi:hypothetical protein
MQQVSIKQTFVNTGDGGLPRTCSARRHLNGQPRLLRTSHNDTVTNISHNIHPASNNASTLGKNAATRLTLNKRLMHSELQQPSISHADNSDMGAWLSCELRSLPGED